MKSTLIKRINMRNYIILAAITVSALAISGCYKDDLEETETIQEGIPVTATLSFSTSVTAPEITVTKAGTDTSFSAVNNLILFIYNEDGTVFEQCVECPKDKIEQMSYSDYKRTYTTSFKTTSGTKTIYAMANYTGVPNFVNEKGDEQGTFDNFVKKLKESAPEKTGEELGKEIYYVAQTYIEEHRALTYDTQQMLLTGTAESVSVDHSGNTSGTLSLRRTVSKIIFKIPETTGKISFVPTTYSVYNLPIGSRLAPGRNFIDGQGNQESYADFYYNTVPVTIGAASNSSYTFEFYMPENIQKDIEIDNYTDRDKWSNGTTETAPENKVWVNAPANGTFVVITGNYSENNENGTLKYSGTVSYTIHLGNFNTEQEGSYGNFTVERNCKYTYTVNVRGIDKIITEVTKEEEQQPGAEGDIVDVSSGAALSYSLDAHYEQVFLQYNLTNIANSISPDSETLDSDIGDKLMLYIESPYHSSLMIKPFTIYSEAVPQAKEEALKGIDYKWVEFLPQNTTTLSEYPGLPDWKSDSGKSDTGLMDAYDACVAMGMAVKAIIQGQTFDDNTVFNSSIIISKDRDQYYARFTGFVDEYYYTVRPDGSPVESWEEFANKPQRRMMISMDTQTSPDYNSTYSKVHTNISQRSIQTFYMPGKNAFGLETFNEMPVMSFGLAAYPDYESENLSRTDGQKNTIILLTYESRHSNGEDTGYGDYQGVAGRGRDWKDYVNYQYNGYLTSNTENKLNENVLVSIGGTNNNYAYGSCMSRNRDLNSDGYIDDDEVRWYVPAVNEYIRMGIGANVMTNEAQLYTGDKSQMTYGNYPEEYISDGAVYLTSSGMEARSYWAVEKASYGRMNYENLNYGRTAVPVRCIRALPANVTESVSTPSESTFTVRRLSNGNTILDFRDVFNAALYRPTIATRPLNSHNEDSETNKYQQGLVIASTTIRSTLLAAQAGGNNDPCRTYRDQSGANSDISAWRTPNLIELTAMAAGVPDMLGTNYLCCTSFSNPEVRAGFLYNGSFITCPNPNTNENGFIRCVRDATQADFDSIQ